MRPGDTEFHVWYHIPYTGSYTFKPRPAMETANLAVMMPKSMTFKQGTPANYEAVTEDVGGGAQAYLARNAKPSEPLEFTISGIGELPRDSATTPGRRRSRSGSGGRSGYHGRLRSEQRHAARRRARSAGG